MKRQQKESKKSEFSVALQSSCYFSLKVCIVQSSRCRVVGGLTHWNNTAFINGGLGGLQWRPSGVWALNHPASLTPHLTCDVLFLPHPCQLCCALERPASFLSRWLIHFWLAISLSHHIGSRCCCNFLAVFSKISELYLLSRGWFCHVAGMHSPTSCRFSHWFFLHHLHVGVQDGTHGDPDSCVQIHQWLPAIS